MKDVPDDLLPALANRVNELPGAGGSRWGKRIFLHTNTIGSDKPRTNITVIATDAQPQITPMAVSLRFSLDGRTFTPEVPASFGGSLLIELVEMIDVKTGPFRESFELEAEDRQPFCGVICMALQVSVTLLGENQSIWVQALAAPTTNIDCADIVGPPTTDTTVTPFTDGAVNRLAAVAAVTTSLPAEPRRAYFSIVNQSAVDLFVRLGDGIDTTPGSELATVVLAPSVYAGYEVLNYTGVITIKFAADDGSGYALTTQGLYPA